MKGHDTMQKAVIYARYSSERQTEQSIEGQIRECMEFAEKNNYQIINQYVDRAISGKTDNRPAFQSMIADSASNTFSIVLVYKLDRFARNRYDSAMYKAKLRKNNVRIVSAKENITDSPEGIILEGLLEAMNEYYSAELSQKIKRGMRENFIKGKTSGGNVALGYRIGDDKHLVVVPEQVAAVKNIFTMYSEGKSFSEIINILKDKKLKTSRGNDFNKSSIQRILSNRRYIGEILFEGEVVGSCPAIVDKELFEKVESMLHESKTKRKTRSSNANYVLTSKLICGKCGNNMSGISGTSKTKNMYYYYVCKKNKCYRLRKDDIESSVIEGIKKYLTNNKIDYIAKEALKIYNKEYNNNSQEKMLEQKARQIEKSISNIMKAIEQGIITATTKSRLDELEREREEISIEISMQKINAPRLNLEHFKYLLGQYCVKLKQKTDSDTFYNQIIDTLISKVIVYDNKIVVTFNLTDQSSPYDNLEYIESVLSSSNESFGGGDGN